MEELEGVEIRPIAGFPGYYVSRSGVIYSRRRKGAMRVLNPFATPKGYLLVRPCCCGHARTRRVHRLVLEAFVGPRPKGHECDHINGIRDDNRAENLRWATPKENVKNAIDRNGGKSWMCGHKRTQGERCGSAKLTDEKVREIRRAYAADGVTQQALADRYGVSQITISDVVRRKKWRHVA